MRFIKEKFSQILREVIVKVSIQLVISNYDEYLAGKGSRRALVSYLPFPLLPPKARRERVMFSNKGIAQEIPRALNELGYVVDIIDYRNSTWRPKKGYDLFIGHGGYNFERLACLLGDNIPSIYFATGVYWKEQNQRLASRLYDLAQRTGVIFPPDRIAPESEENSLLRADGIICLGNEETKETFREFANVVAINNAVFPLNKSIPEPLDFNIRRRHFLYFCGRGNVHKGLDLLLEAFSGTDLHLHVCQHMQPEFIKVFDAQLKMPNIHIEGFVKMRSQRFNQLAQLCNWIIMPTCAEGQPGSVLECMAYGLIPILPRTANLDIDEIGIKINELTVDSVIIAIREALTWDKNKATVISKSVRETVKRKHYPDVFRANFANAVVTILKQISNRPALCKRLANAP